MYFLRFTDTAEEDLKRGTSIHAHDEGGKETILDGLCGYMLESDNIEDAIEEVEEGSFQLSFVGRPVIFAGKVAAEDHLVPDGDLFIPFRIEKKL